MQRFDASRRAAMFCAAGTRHAPTALHLSGHLTGATAHCCLLAAGGGGQGPPAITASTSSTVRGTLHRVSAPAGWADMMHAGHGRNAAYMQHASQDRHLTAVQRRAKPLAGLA